MLYLYLDGSRRLFNELSSSDQHMNNLFVSYRTKKELSDELRPRYHVIFGQEETAIYCVCSSMDQCSITRSLND